MSNFFPSQNTLQEYFREGDYYARLFSTEIQNPLGWQINPLKSAREELISILESYDYTDLQYQKGIKVASIDIDLEMFAFFYNVQNHFPITDSNKLLDEMIFRNNLDKVLSQNFDFMNEQLQSGQIPIFIHRSIEPSEIQSSMIEAIDDLQKNVSPDTPFWSMEEDLLNLMVLYLKQSPEIRKNYHKHLFKMGTESFEVLVHRKIKQRKTKPTGPNYYLRLLIESKDNDPHKVLLDGYSDTRKADNLFHISSNYFHSDPEYCIIILKQVLELNPDHKEAKKDLRILESR